MRRNLGLWIGGGIFALLFVVLSVFAVMAYTGKEEPVAKPAEQAAPAKAEEIFASVATGKSVNGLLVAWVDTPGEGSLHWENSQGLVSSDTMTWESPMTGDIELSPIGGTTGLRPVLTTPQGVVKGNPLP